MYRLILSSLVIALILFSCGQDSGRLEKDSPAYNFAKKISEKVIGHEKSACTITFQKAKPVISGWTGFKI